ncbi:MAG: MBL fold metallo-hydrolase [bacterium]
MENIPDKVSKFMGDKITFITGDIIQVRLPLPFALRIVNCYLIRDRGGWCVIDTGLHTPEGQAVWESVFAVLKIRKDELTRIVLTHCHPDHYGMAGWLQQYFSDGKEVPMPPVLVSQRELENARTVFQPQIDLAQTIFEFFSSCGTPADISNSIVSDLQNIRKATQPHPLRIEFLKPGSELQIGDHTFRVLHTPGHSDGHLVFFEAETGLMLSGDHVLMEITPNISLWPLSEPNPLGRYLESLEQLAQLNVKSALPGHRQVITNWQARIAELQAHHEERLANMKAAINGSATPFQVSSRVFDLHELTTHEIRFAVTETLAHLEHLVVEEQISKNVNGVWRYSLQ